MATRASRRVFGRSRQAFREFRLAFRARIAYDTCRAGGGLEKAAAASFCRSLLWKTRPGFFRRGRICRTNYSMTTSIHGLFSIGALFAARPDSHGRLSLSRITIQKHQLDHLYVTCQRSAGIHFLNDILRT